MDEILDRIETLLGERDSLVVPVKWLCTVLGDDLRGGGGSCGEAHGETPDGWTIPPL